MCVLGAQKGKSFENTHCKTKEHNDNLQRQKIINTDT